jgi:hypothetical protein
MKRSDIEKFWKHVIVGPKDKCWPWKGIGKNRYGQMLVNGTVRSAHRLSYEIHNGPIPDGLFVCHKCDNPPCVNPEHLFLGTNLDNVRDAMQKGRAKMPPINDNSGERCGTSKLTSAQVLEIARRIDAGELHKDLSAKFGVSSSVISRINTGRRWSSVTGRSIVNSKEWRKLPRPETSGEKHPRHKLTQGNIFEICKRLDSGESQRKIATIIGVSRAAIESIDQGKSWGWLTKRKKKDMAKE